jgi:hypothetical protein
MKIQITDWFNPNKKIKSEHGYIRYELWMYREIKRLEKMGINTVSMITNKDDEIALVDSDFTDTLRSEARDIKELHLDTSRHGLQ